MKELVELSVVLEVVNSVPALSAQEKLYKEEVINALSMMATIKLMLSDEIYEEG